VTYELIVSCVQEVRTSRYSGSKAKRKSWGKCKNWPRGGKKGGKEVGVSMLDQARPAKLQGEGGGEKSK